MLGFICIYKGANMDVKDHFKVDRHCCGTCSYYLINKYRNLEKSMCLNFGNLKQIYDFIRITHIKKKRIGERRTEYNGLVEIEVLITNICSIMSMPDFSCPFYEYRNKAYTSDKYPNEFTIGTLTVRVKN